MRQRLEAQDSRLNALVNNAGISPKGEGGRRLGAIETSLEDWQHVFQVNFFAPIMLARGLIAELERAKGAVVNVTSIAGGRVHPFAGAAYATSKAALASLTREMAADFGPRGIRVNAISPGEIDTAILSPGTDKIVQEQIPLQPPGRAGGGGQSHLFPVHRPVELRERRRVAHQRRPARLTRSPRERAPAATPMLACRPPPRRLYTRTRRPLLCRRRSGRAERSAAW